MQRSTSLISTIIPGREAHSSHRNTNDNIIAAEGVISTLMYPEFENFSIHLTDSVKKSDNPLEGYVTLTLKEGFANCVKDVVVECCAIFCTNFLNFPKQVYRLHTCLERGAAPFESGGLPAGVYEFPFVFTLPSNLPPTLEFFETTSYGYRSKSVISWSIKAFVIPDPSSPLKRKIMRAKLPFQRLLFLAPSPHLALKVSQSKTFTFSNHLPLTMHVSLPRDNFPRGALIPIHIEMSNHSERTVYSLIVALKQLTTCWVVNAEQNREGKVVDRKVTLCTQEFKDNLPLRKNSEFSGTLPFLPALYERLPDSTAGSHPDLIAPSFDYEGPELRISVKYLLNVQAHVHLGGDLKASLEFRITDSIPPKYSPARPSTSPSTSALQSCSNRPPSFHFHPQLSLEAPENIHFLREEISASKLNSPFSPQIDCSPH
eukprot:Sdes_comp15951_c0_seq1m5097